LLASLEEERKEREKATAALEAERRGNQEATAQLEQEKQSKEEVQSALEVQRKEISRLVQDKEQRRQQEKNLTDKLEAQTQSAENHSAQIQAAEAELDVKSREIQDQSCQIHILTQEVQRLNQELQTSGSSEGVSSLLREEISELRKSLAEEKKNNDTKQKRIQELEHELKEKSLQEAKERRKEEECQAVQEARRREAERRRELLAVAHEAIAQKDAELEKKAEEISRYHQSAVLLVCSSLELDAKQRLMEDMRLALTEQEETQEQMEQVLDEKMSLLQELSAEEKHVDRRFVFLQIFTEKHQAERRKWQEEKLSLIGQAKEAEDKRNQEMRKFAEDRERYSRQQSLLVRG
ncbi:hypothetical protein XENOCAPTIV_018614, partial [Xenoophorus captivus]